MSRNTTTHIILCMCGVLLGTYLEGELLEHGAGLCSTLADLASLEGFAAVCMAHKRAQELPVLQTSPTNDIVGLLEPRGQTDHGIMLQV